MFYDILSSNYDQFVNWNSRLESEIPFLEKVLATNNVRTVLDSACGTGMHAIALAKLGFQSYGCDLSESMIKIAEKNAEHESAKVKFFPAGFGEISDQADGFPYDSVICLGNSLPHVRDTSELTTTLLDFGKLLNNHGTLILQNRNFDTVMDLKERWMEPQYSQLDGSETLFHRFYDFNPDDTITFNMLVTSRKVGEGWRQSVITTHLLPLPSDLMENVLLNTGYCDLQFFGDLAGSTFDKKTSPNCVIVARKD